MSKQSATAAVVTTTELTKQLPVEVTVAHWDPEVECINAVEFKKKFQNGEYAEVFHLNVINDHGSAIDNDAVRLLITEFGDMLCEELHDGLPPERDIEHSLQRKSDARPSTRAPFRHAHDVLIASSTFLIVGEDHDFMQLIQNSYSNDRDCAAVLQSLGQKDQSVMARYELKDGLLRVRSKDAVAVIRVPQVEAMLLRVLHDFHDSSVVSHSGIQPHFQRFDSSGGPFCENTLLSTLELAKHSVNCVRPRSSFHERILARTHDDHAVQGSNDSVQVSTGGWEE
ncbi:hypothetical protein PsorP6_002169 [Peronosclerospora sorghi]|uniref:Uncharacterized protein n=1 Tax=Peronosclerospora sorghi TaxID=230839 RepID=A0ACC0WUE0_9STRA|nr:hypothetical protein PsorP6_002169 [Peronosclerospora sorghi]